MGRGRRGRIPLPKHRVILAEVVMEEGEITMEELDRASRKLKQRKCGGPDGTSIEMFKAMDEGPRKQVLQILNQWWCEESIDKEALRAPGDI